MTESSGLFCFHSKSSAQEVTQNVKGSTEPKKPSDLRERQAVLFRMPVPSAKREPEEKPVCSRSSHCEGCPYPSHGFVCWHDEERCLRTEMEKIHQRDRKNAAKKQIHN